MALVIPSVLVKTKEEVERHLARVEGLVQRVQIDVVDGKFDGPHTWPYTAPGVTDLPQKDGWLFRLGAFSYEIDLMVENPGEVAEAWIRGGASRLIFHDKSVKDLPALIESLRERLGYEKGFASDLLSFGLALPSTGKAENLAAKVEAVDFVQFMGIEDIGTQGQPFDPRVLDAVRAFRKQYPDTPVQVDGAVTRMTAPELLEAGVGVLAIGHALWESKDIPAEIAYYEELPARHGIYHR